MARKRVVQREAVAAPWQMFVNHVEEQRLIVLDQRIQRRKDLVRWDQSERTAIMHRAIRRMRRAEGKE